VHGRERTNITLALSLEGNMSSKRISAAVLAAGLCVAISGPSDRAWAQSASERFRAVHPWANRDRSEMRKKENRL
jgi:hypothetical protein